MKKIGKFLMMMLCLSLLTGCGAASLSDKYDEEIHHYLKDDSLDIDFIIYPPQQ